MSDATPSWTSPEGAELGGHKVTCRVTAPSPLPASPQGFFSALPCSEPEGQVAPRSRSLLSLILLLRAGGHPRQGPRAELLVQMAGMKGDHTPTPAYILPIGRMALSCPDSNPMDIAFQGSGHGCSPRPPPPRPGSHDGWSRPDLHYRPFFFHPQGLELVGRKGGLAQDRVTRASCSRS